MWPLGGRFSTSRVCDWISVDGVGTNNADTDVRKVVMVMKSVMVSKRPWGLAEDEAAPMYVQLLRTWSQ